MSRRLPVLQHHRRLPPRHFLPIFWASVPSVALDVEHNPKARKGEHNPSPGPFSRRSGFRVALDQLSLAIRPGEIFGLLGPNGAGKTTLLKILATLIIPTSGKAWVNGHELSAAPAVRDSLTSVISDERSFYWRLTGHQNLEFFGTLHRLDPAALRVRISEVLHLVGLEHAAHQPVGSCSSGKKQRLALARALLPQKPVLLLDEPTKGLDPVATRRIHRLLKEELAQNRNFRWCLPPTSLRRRKLCVTVWLSCTRAVSGVVAPPRCCAGNWLFSPVSIAPAVSPTRTHQQTGGVGHSPSPQSPENGQVLLEWQAPDNSLHESFRSASFTSRPDDISSGGAGGQSGRQFVPLLIIPWPQMAPF
uniref:ABC transporter ATP-binding protein n=1 Tax=Desulfobacca acetoxidans TaxID=60893 RepID=A0A7V6A1V8_9BACT